MNLSKLIKVYTEELYISLYVNSPSILKNLIEQYRWCADEVGILRYNVETKD